MTTLANDNNARADELIDEFIAGQGGDHSVIKDYLALLLDPSTRESAFADPRWFQYMGIPNDSGMWRGILHVLLADEKVWNEIDRMYLAGEATYMTFDVMLATYRDHDLLNHYRYEQSAQRRGLLKVWQTHGLPDFCTETYQSWICEL